MSGTRAWAYRAAELFSVVMVSTSVQATVNQADFDRTANAIQVTLMANPELALRRGRLAEKVASSLPDVNKREIALATIERMEGDAYIRLDQLDQAASLIDRARTTARRLAPGTKLEGETLLSSGSIHGGNIQLAAALLDYQKAFHLFQKLGDARAQAIALLYISTLYDDANDYQSALKYLDQAIAVYRGDANLLLSIYNNRSAALQELGRYAEAEAGYRKALGLARQRASPMLEARILGNIARVKLKVGNAVGADAAVAEALRIAAAGDAKEARPQLIGIAAQAAYQRRDYSRAAALIRERFAGVDLSSTTIAFREAHQTAYELYRVLGDAPLAVAHLAAWKRLDDQATKLATSANIALSAARFDSDNQKLKIRTLQLQDANRKAEYERQRARTERLIFLLLGGAAAILTGFLAFGVVTLKRSRDTVRAAAANLAVTNQALGKALAAKTEFLATTSHEIRTPLNGILGMTQVMLADARLSAETRDRIGVVHGAGVTMRALVDDILDVAKMETGNLTVERAPFDLCATLTEAAKLWREQAQGKGIGFAVDLAGCPARIEGDAARVRQIVFNLLSNALKFTAEGAVALRAEQIGGTYRVTISDTGIGIAADQLEMVFESFRQADAGTTRRFGGTGLGLSICRSLARAMDGEVTVRSVPGQGSTFTLELPLIAAASGASEAEVSSDAAPRTGILVIDPNPISRATLATLVSKRAIDVVALTSMEAAFAGHPADRAVVDQGALAALDDPARSLAALGDRVGEVTLLWKGEMPSEIADAVTRIVTKPVGGSALLAAVFGVLCTADTAPLVQRAA